MGYFFRNLHKLVVFAVFYGITNLLLSFYLDAYFWVGKGRPSPQGLRVPDENGGTLPLKAYRGKTIVITLPDDVTVYDIDYLSVWCEEYSVNFADLAIPKNLNVPPSLRMLGVAPQVREITFSFISYSAQK